MNFDTSTIKMHYWGDDRVFRLFLKYNIRAETNVQFVKDYISKNPGPAVPKMISCRDLGFYWLDDGKNEEKNKEQFLELLDDPRDYKTKEEGVFTKGYLMSLMAMKASGKDMASSLLDMKHQMQTRTTYYLSPAGVLKAHEIFPENMQTKELSIQFKKMVFYAAVMTETKNGKAPIGSV
jgi:hypothetical protein